MERITLFELENEGIKISMKLYFNEEDQLIFDGYDIGKTVSELLGDSDYEYTYTIEPDQVQKLYKAFGIPTDDRKALLLEAKKRFGGNDAYTDFGKFMDENEIGYKPFTWT